MLQQAVGKRKWRELPVIILLSSLLLGCQNVGETEAFSDSTRYPEEAGIKEEPRYISEISKEECLLCGDGEGTLLPLYWGEENIGVISLNTFELAYIGINRYDDYGKLIEEPAKGSSMTRISTGGGGFSFMTYEDTNRGYARCDLYFNNDEVLDIEQTATHMCTECMNRVIIDDWGEPTGMAVIDFGTGELKLLRESLLAFQFGDFYISCKTERDEAGEKGLEMDLLVFYCPKRYEEKNKILLPFITFS